ncbi:DUF6069 family protein [Streptomyces sp. NPDC050149]|uniref:DUF6069 family protein n=1 Tax=Streptomyces sp. NPDC050149 TaxID=3365603 RepID=UPI00379E0A07
MTPTPQASLTVTTQSAPRRATALGCATLATGLLWLAAQALDVDLRVEQGAGKPPMDVSLPAVIGFTLLSSLLGWGALFLLEKRARRARTIWTALAITVLLVSLVPVFAAEATLGAKTVLSLMHVTVAAVLIPMLRRGAWPTM